MLSKLLNRVIQALTHACQRRELEETTWESDIHISLKQVFKMRMQSVHWSKMQLECELTEEITCKLRGVDEARNFLYLAPNAVVSHWNTQQSHKPEALTCFMDSPFSWNWHYKENFLGPKCFLLQPQFPSTLAGHLQSLVSCVMFPDVSCDQLQQDLWAPVWLSHTKPVCSHLCDDPSPTPLTSNGLFVLTWVPLKKDSFDQYIIFDFHSLPISTLWPRLSHGFCCLWSMVILCKLVNHASVLWKHFCSGYMGWFR